MAIQHIIKGFYMRSLKTLIASWVIHSVITRFLGMHYNFILEPFDVGKLMLDIAGFGLIFGFLLLFLKLSEVFSRG